MPDAIDTARRVLETRLTELEAEATKIRTALRGLGAKGAAPRAPRTAKQGPRPAKRSRKRAPRGQRRAQVLNAIKKSPGATAAELGKQIGISTNQAYGLTQRLLKEGEIKRKGKGYCLA